MNVIAISIAHLTSAMKEFVEEGRKERVFNAKMLRDLTSDKNKKHDLSYSDNDEDYDDENIPPPKSKFPSKPLMLKVKC